jgi:hypothetical protein
MVFWECNTVDEVTPIIGTVSIDDLIKPDTVSILSVTVDPSYQTSLSDDWIFVSSTTGKVLGWKRFESGESFDLKAYINFKPSFVTISVLQVFETATRTTFNLRSYARIPREKNWLLTRLIENKRNALGNIDIVIQNSPRPSYTYFQASDNFGGQSYSFSYNLGTTTLDFTLFESVTRIGVTISTLTNQIKYLEIEKPVLVGNYTYDFLNDFVSPDHEALVSLGSNVYVSAVIRGLQDLTFNKNLRLKGLALTEAGYLEGADQIPLGYNNGFPYYYTELSVDKESYHYQYEKLGDPPIFEILSVPANPIKIENNIFSSFSISGGNAYADLQNLWNRTETLDSREYMVEWSIYCPRNAYPVLNEFPPEIVAKYPWLDFDHDLMNLENVKVIRNILNYGYDEMIEELIKDNQEDYRPHEYETITVPN